MFENYSDVEDVETKDLICKKGELEYSGLGSGMFCIVPINIKDYQNDKFNGWLKNDKSKEDAIELDFSLFEYFVQPFAEYYVNKPVPDYHLIQSNYFDEYHGTCFSRMQIEVLTRELLDLRVVLKNGDYENNAYLKPYLNNLAAVTRFFEPDIYLAMSDKESIKYMFKFRKELIDFYDKFCNQLRAMLKAAYEKNYEYILCAYSDIALFEPEPGTFLYNDIHNTHSF